MTKGKGSGIRKLVYLFGDFFEILWRYPQKLGCFDEVFSINPIFFFGVMILFCFLGVIFKFFEFFRTFLKLLHLVAILLDNAFPIINYFVDRSIILLDFIFLLRANFLEKVNNGIITFMVILKFL